LWSEGYHRDKKLDLLNILTHIIIVMKMREKVVVTSSRWRFLELKDSNIDINMGKKWEHRISHFGRWLRSKNMRTVTPCTVEYAAKATFPPIFI
jgi:hypothetical protein